MKQKEGDDSCIFSWCTWGCGQAVHVCDTEREVKNQGLSHDSGFHEELTVSDSEYSLFHFSTQTEWPMKASKEHCGNTPLNTWTWNLMQGTSLLTFTAVEYCSAYFWHSSILLCFISISETSIYKCTQVSRKATRNSMLSNSLRSQALRNTYIT